MVKQEELIAVSFDRSINFIVAILAILKIGAAYVPVDPGYPLKRMQYIFSDTKTNILLTEGGLFDKFTRFHGMVIDINNYPVIENNTRFPKVESSNLAYVIYTSGSTDEPKGVLVEHKSIIRLVVCSSRINRYYQI